MISFEKYLMVHFSVPYLSHTGAYLSFYNTNEPPHDKTNKMACAPSEDSDQTDQKAWVLSYPLSAQ